MNHGPNVSLDVLDRNKYQGPSGMDQMSCKAPVPPRPTESENTMGFGYMF